MKTSTEINERISIIGGGLAGCEAAWQLAKLGKKVILHEMRPLVQTFAHQTDGLAELVCSNSFRSNNHDTNAVGQLHWEMLQADSLIIKAGYNNAVEAGSALAVDRIKFSKEITNKIMENPLIEINRAEVKDIPDLEMTIVATGPLTSENLTNFIQSKTEKENLAFFDAIAPIIYADSIDEEKTWKQSRYDKGETKQERMAYLNCPLNKNQYYEFIDNLLTGDKTVFKDWEKDTPYFNGCLPVEVMAERGKDTLRFGPMKPVGLLNPKNFLEKPYAVVQLRKENKAGSLYNMVGFQTKLTYSAQVDVFRQIPGLQKAEFARLGGIHRNTFINSPKLLDNQLRLVNQKNIRFAGQITGVEGYVESATTGLLSAWMTFYETQGKNFTHPPSTTCMGALLSHITDLKEPNNFQPMNINFGLLPPLSNIRIKKDRYLAYTKRAKQEWMSWWKTMDIQESSNTK